MSRAFMIGNIYTRTEGLVRKGFLTENKIPLWLEVYKHFPPKYDPTFKRIEPDINVKEILYKEDALRAKIHKAFEGRLGVFSFQDNKKSNSQILLKSCMELISEGMAEDEAVKKIEVFFKSNTNEESNVDQVQSSQTTKQISEVS